LVLTFKASLASYMAATMQQQAVVCSDNAVDGDSAVVSWPGKWERRFCHYCILAIHLQNQLRQQQRVQAHNQRGSFVHLHSVRGDVLLLLLLLLLLQAMASCFSGSWVCCSILSRTSILQGVPLLAAVQDPC
jgi:hypothetical protein